MLYPVAKQPLLPLLRTMCRTVSLGIRAAYVLIWVQEMLVLIQA